VSGAGFKNKQWHAAHESSLNTLLVVSKRMSVPVNAGAVEGLRQTGHLIEARM
jgi:hypothetical protein